MILVFSVYRLPKGVKSESGGVDGGFKDSDTF